MNNVSAATPAATTTQERGGKAANRWTALVPVVIGCLLAFADMAVGITTMAQSASGSTATRVGLSAFIVAVLLLVFMIMVSSGFFTLQPNEARVLVLFGEYRGTARGSGFYWANPFYGRTLSVNGMEEIKKPRRRTTAIRAPLPRPSRQKSPCVPERSTVRNSR